MRAALLHADEESGLMFVATSVGTALREHGWALKRGPQIVMTAAGRKQREMLLKTRQVVTVNGLPFEKVDEITDRYLQGQSLEGISQRCRVQIDDVEAALRFRQVLVGA
jgi:hypothetical protein